MKRIVKCISLFIALLIALNVICTAPFMAQIINGLEYVDYPGIIVEPEEYPGMTFKIIYTHATVCSYTGNATEIVIPDYVNGYPVNLIDSGAFKDSPVESVTVPDTVAEFGGGVFEGCTDLRAVKLSENLVNLHSKTFKGCSSLESIYIPDSVQYIEDGCFTNCSSLREIRLSDSLKMIGDSFIGCSSLESIHVPRSVSSVFPEAFINCDSLSEITVDENNESFKAEDGVLFSKDGTKLISYPQARPADSYDIPVGVTSIAEMAFYRAYGLTRLGIPDTVNEIGNHAFQFCVYLTDIEVPDSVEKLGAYILDSTGWFYAQPEGVLYMGNCVYGFKGKMPQTAVIKDGTKKIYPYAFSRSDYYLFADNQFIKVDNSAYDMKHIILPDSLISIGEHSFDYGGLEDLSIPDSVTEIGDYAFYMSSLTEVNIGDGVERIGAHAFSTCENIKKLTIGSGVRSVGDWAFGGLNHLTDLELKYGITELGWYMFAYCYDLERVKIPASVKSIPFKAFANCYDLSEIEFPDTPISVNSTAFDETSWYDNQPDGIVYTGRNAFALKGDIPDDLVLADGTASVTKGWLFLRTREFTDKNVVLPEGYAHLVFNSFDLNDTCSITIPSGVAQIEEGSFMDYYSNKKPTVYGYTDSAAESFAGEKHCPFIPIGVELHDDATGIEIGVPDGVNMSVSEVDKSVMPERLPHGGETEAVYDISLTKDGEPAESGKTSIKIPCKSKNRRAYHITESGEIQVMRAVYCNGFLVFAAEEAGVYATVYTPDEEPYRLGDADCSGEADSVDATLIQRYSTMMPTAHDDTIMQGDVNMDGVVDIVDTTCIQRSEIRIRTPYPINSLV